MRQLASITFMLFALSACSTPELPSLSSLPGPTDLPFIHKLDVQQGNVVDQEMLARLQPRMDKKKVQFIMGTPVIHDTFNAHRWDYLYTFTPGGGETERRLITLVFDGDELDHIEGDVVPAAQPLVAELHQDTTVKVPRIKPKTFMTKIKEKIPFTEETPNVVEDEEALTDEERAELDAMFAVEDVEPTSPYADIQAGPGEGIVVPPDAPRAGQRKKGFFARLFGSLAAEDDELDDDDDYDAGDPRYRDITDQDDI